MRKDFDYVQGNKLPTLGEIRLSTFCGTGWCFISLNEWWQNFILSCFQLKRVEGKTEEIFDEKKIEIQTVEYDLPEKYDTENLVRVLIKNALTLSMQKDIDFNRIFDEERSKFI